MTTVNRTNLAEVASAGTLWRTAVSNIDLHVPDVAAATGFYSRALVLVHYADLADGAVRRGWGTGHHVLDLHPGTSGLHHIANEVRDRGELSAETENFHDDRAHYTPGAGTRCRAA